MQKLRIKKSKSKFFEKKFTFTKIGILILEIFILSIPFFSFSATIPPVDTSAHSNSVDTSNPAFDISTGQAQSLPSNSTGVTLNNVNTQTDTFGNTNVIPSNESQVQGGQPANSINDASQNGFSIVPTCKGKYGECTWGDLVVLARNIMYYMIFLGTTLAALSVAYAGFMYATSSGNSGKIEKAHHVFTTVAIGLIFLWGGWLLVATIMNTLGVKNAYSLVNSSGVQSVNNKNTGN